MLLLISEISKGRTPLTQGSMSSCWEVGRGIWDTVYLALWQSPRTVPQHLRSVLVTVTVSTEVSAVKSPE
jgi:hypothetical protein